MTFFWQVKNWITENTIKLKFYHEMGHEFRQLNETNTFVNLANFGTYYLFVGFNSYTLTI